LVRNLALITAETDGHEAVYAP